MDLKQRIIERIKHFEELASDELEIASTTSAIIPKAVARAKWKAFKNAATNLEKDLYTPRGQ